MLEPWIIEQIRRREEEERRRHERPLLELPIPDDLPPEQDGSQEDRLPLPDEPQRGVVIISM